VQSGGVWAFALGVDKTDTVNMAETAQANWSEVALMTSPPASIGMLPFGLQTVMEGVTSIPCKPLQIELVCNGNNHRLSYSLCESNAHADLHFMQYPVCFAITTK
jgi:hypothetical protein